MPEKLTPPETYLRLRQLALDMKAKSAGPGELNPRHMFGVVMDMPLAQGTATLTSFQTGDASLYFSSGGGFIGVKHESVKRFAKEFVASAAKFLPLMKPAESLALPDAQMVAFYALTPGGVLKAEDRVDDLGQKKSELSPLFYAGQNVISAYRILNTPRP